MLRYLCCLAVLMFLAMSAHADPDYSQDVWYYDEDGDLIGWTSLPCSGGLMSGGDTSDLYEVFTMPCHSYIPEMTCASQGLQTLSGCDTSCYSQSYVMSFNADMVYNCIGLCVGGEGPGLPQSNPKYCNTCYKGTGSCPASLRSRPKRKLRPTLRAGIEAKMWEIFPSLRTQG